MKLHCPDCGSRIKAADMNLDTLAAKCAECNSVFSFASALESNAQRLPATAPAPPMLTKPDRMKTEDFAGDLTITWRWFTPMAFFLLFFCIAWDSFLFFWYSQAFSQKETPWLMIVFPIAHLAVGVGLTYTVLAMFLNKTIVRVSGGMLKVSHVPLPWGVNRSLPSSDIEQLFCEKKEVRNKNSVTGHYTLFALLRGGKRVKLLSNLESASEARYLETLLEQRLRIPQRLVAGEVELV